MSKPRICIFTNKSLSHSETFILAHVEHLPAEVVFLYGSANRVRDIFDVAGTRLVFCTPIVQLTQLAARKMVGAPWAEIRTSLLTRFLLRNQVRAVLAEYGMQGVGIRKACAQAHVPLIVHFHGYDAYRDDVLHGLGKGYPELFQQASAIIAVSRAMEYQLLNMGAPRGKLHYNPYGVDPSAFRGAKPGVAPPLFLAVGRFVEKKAPNLTLSAFRQVLTRIPNARLTMIGDGYLHSHCQQLAESWGMAESVEFAGCRTHQEVARAMRQARVFVQHSVRAKDGDSEGTPVAILEAGASGLPVVSTRHAGIPEVVLDQYTGFLVDEGDVDGMAKHMITLAESAELASRLGRAARARIADHFSLDKSIEGLWTIVNSVL